MNKIKNTYNIGDKVTLKIKRVDDELNIELTLEKQGEIEKTETNQNSYINPYEEIIKEFGR